MSQTPIDDALADPARRQKLLEWLATPRGIAAVVDVLASSRPGLRLDDSTRREALLDALGNRWKRETVLEALPHPGRLEIVVDVLADPEWQVLWYHEGVTDAVRAYAWLAQPDDEMKWYHVAEVFGRLVPESPFDNENFLPMPGLFVGAGPVRVSGRVETDAHTLFYQLGIETAERVAEAAGLRKQERDWHSLYRAFQGKPDAAPAIVRGLNLIALDLDGEVMPLLRVELERALATLRVAARSQPKLATYDSPPPPDTDGPLLPNIFRWRGNRVELAPIPWKLPNALWGRDSRPVEEVTAEVWGDNDATESRIKTALGRMNESLLTAGNGVPAWGIKSGHFVRR
jgi:hypothetical protein